MQSSLPDAAEILKALIACRSVTPADDGAQAYLAEILANAGFTISRLTFREAGTPDVENLFATVGSGAPHLVFGGHTDVVPPGDELRWRHPPFAGEVADGMMFGRGAVDMKGGIAAFVAATLGLVAEARPKGTLSLAITGDEEGPSVNGTVKLLAWAKEQGHRFDAALVGEPTSQKVLGDTIKIGRRGSLSGTILVRGKQGHVAYPHLAENPIPPLVRIIDRLYALRLDRGSADFEPSNLEVTGIDVGNQAFNVIPAEAKTRFNVRFNDRWSIPALQTLLMNEIRDAAGAPCEIAFQPGAGDWFHTHSPALIAPLADAIKAVTGLSPATSTGGGTSDARFFKDACPVVEFGLVGDTMHHVDERVPLADLATLTAIYRGFLDRYFGTQS